MPQPKWLTDLSSKQRAVILTKAHAILLDYPFDDQSLLAQDLQRAAGTVWALKCACEQAIETESKASMIQLNANDETALNTATGGKCRIVYVNNVAYTNIAGLFALETGNYTPAQLRNLVKQWHHNGNTEYLALLKPIDFNGSWLYSVSGWDMMRERAQGRRKKA